MTSTLLKSTALHRAHLARGARMVEFSGWEMPLQFGKVLEEHHAVRNHAGLFDISHMGLVCVACGNPEKTRTFLDRLVPQDLSRLYPGKAVYTQFLNEDGGILDDIIVYRLPEAGFFPGFEEFLVICNAANTGQDLSWMRQHLPNPASQPAIQVNWQQEYGLLALQGPRFSEVLTIAGLPPDQLPQRFHVSGTTLTLGGQAIRVLVCRTGYTGEDGVELVVRNEAALPLWEGLLEVGETFGLQPIGLAARDTLRLEAAYPLHGHDISQADTPLEAGLGWSVKLDKPSGFIGRQALKQQEARGLARNFYCLKLLKKTIARQHDILLKQGQAVGEVTSGSISPTLGEPIAMGYIRSGVVSGPGDRIQIRVRGQAVDAEIVARPFYKAR